MKYIIIILSLFFISCTPDDIAYEGSIFQLQAKQIGIEMCICNKIPNGEDEKCINEIVSKLKVLNFMLGNNSKFIGNVKYTIHVNQYLCDNN